MAHAVVVLTIGAMWALPHSHSPAVAARPRISPSAAAADTTSQPLQQMATRPRLTSSLPDAAGAFYLVPAVVHPPTRSQPSKKAAVPRASVIASAPAIYNAPRSGWGNDISWPQCGGSVPGAHDIGVIGVTNGRPFTTNPCLAAEDSWAKGSQMPGGAQLYLNLEIGGSSNGPHGCAADDHACRAYDYGWMSVVDAMGRASSRGVSSTFWWLDVEVGNNWADDVNLNARTVQGAVDAVHSRNLDVGIYSSVDQWAQIVPPEYQPGVPTWLAVVGNQAMAPHLCNRAYSLTGGPVYLVQYDDHVFDWDHVCSAGAAGFAAAAARHGH